MAALTFLGHLRQVLVDFHIIEPPRGAGRCRRLPEASGQPTRPPPRHHAQTNADRTRYLDGLLVSGAGARVETVRFERLAHPSRHRDMGRRCSHQNGFLVAVCSGAHSRSGVEKNGREACPTTIQTRWLTWNHTGCPLRDARSRAEREDHPKSHAEIRKSTAETGR